jgi:outer membrane protein assembly factor BamD
MKLSLRLTTVWLIAFLAFSCAKTNFNKVLKSNDYEYKLRMAEQYFVKKKYSKAQQLYEELFPVYKGTKQFEDLYYKFAYCSYYQKNYMEAANLFQGFLEYFPTSIQAEEAAYMYAYSHYMQSPRAELDQMNTIKSMGLMQTFINTHPGSTRSKEAERIILEGAEKLEKKELLSCELYYKTGQYRAAAISYSQLVNNYPLSAKADEYKLSVIRSYYKYAEKSIPEKQLERYNKVIEEYEDFEDRYPESKLLKEAERYLTLSQTNLKALTNNEQTKEATGNANK